MRHCAKCNKEGHYPEIDPVRMAVHNQQNQLSIRRTAFCVGADRSEAVLAFPKPDKVLAAGPEFVPWFCWFSHFLSALF